MSGQGLVVTVPLLYIRVCRSQGNRYDSQNCERLLFIIMQMLDALLHQEILLTVLDLGGVMERLTHVAGVVEHPHPQDLGGGR